jgi:hypothetical protein
MLEALKPVISDIGSIVMSVARGILSVVMPIVTKIVQVVAPITTTIFKIVHTTLTKLISVVGTAVGRIKSVISSISAVIGSVRSTFNSIKSAMSKPIETARNTISGILSRIRGFFPLSIGKIFRNLKLPHISVSGGSAPFGIGGKGSLPKFSVSWYRKAEDQPYLFKERALFGAGDGHNDEMLYGKQALMDDIAEATDGGGDTIVNLYYDASDEAKDMVYDIARGLKRYKMAGVF